MSANTEVEDRALNAAELEMVNGTRSPAIGQKTKEELKNLTQRKLATMSRNPSLLKGLFFRCCVADFFG